MKRRPDGSLLVSVALHVVLGVALLWVLSIPVPFRQWMHPEPSANTPQERIGYIALPSGGGGRAPQSAPPARPAAPAAPSKPLVAPRAVPSTLPPAPPAKSAAPSPSGQSGGAGEAGGAGGVGALQRGITPSFDDPRVWLPPDAVGTPRGAVQALDSVLASRIAAHNDSLAEIAAHAGRAPGDWTFKKNGKKYGIDRKKIYIGDLSLPTAILALLPLNKGGNPTEVQQERALNAQRNEIMEQAQRAMNEEDFQKAVKQIRERKQREHDAEMKRKEQEKKKAEEKAIAEP
ncbi:MAG TPA: hypothetical protein VFS44_11745 [Gemmatimonadaceae bacterium]|nr:hypothetical protein [Gemmatimonadaceae bacterium]